MREAEDYVTLKQLDMKVYEIEERRGEPVRCAQGWCLVAHICDQYQGEVWAAKEAKKREMDIINVTGEDENGS